MTTETNTNAQVPVTAPDNVQATTPDPAQAPAPGAQQFEGFQKRIDEITAKVYAKDDVIQQQQQQIQQLMVTLSQRANEPAPSQAPAPDLSALDPDIRKAFELMTAQQNATFQRQQAQILAQTQDYQLKAITAGQDPRVVAQANLIWNDAKSKGAHMQGYTPEMALTYARGQLFDVLTASRTQDAQVKAGQNFNAQAQVIQAQSPVAPVSGNTQAITAPDPEDDPEGAAAFFAKRLGDKVF